MEHMVNIYAFSDYRAFLKAWLQEAKTTKTSNLSRLAEVAKVHATFLSHVLTGDKHLSLEQAAFLSEYFGHTRLERDYFFVLIHLDRAGTPILREYWEEKKLQLEKEKNKLSARFDPHHELTPEQRATFYSSWLYVAIWVSTDIAGGQTLPQIAARFRLKPTKAEEIMTFLVQTGICVEEKGKFHMGKTHVHVPNESPLVVKHHSNWRMKAMQRMDFREEAELFFTAPMSISKKDFAAIREKLNVVIKEAVEVAKASRSEDLFCLNIDFFQSEA
ncbi:MAG: TIGR02147 family protein [Bacteriovoracia bacterium]